MRPSGTSDAGQAADGARILGRATQRERLLAGMAHTVARRGYAATPVAEVLKSSGVSRRTFYEQFADKEDCFLAAYDAIVRACGERLVLAYHGGRDWEHGLACAYDALLRTLAAEPDFAHLGVVDVLGAGPRALARRDAALRRLARFVVFTRERAATRATPPPLVGQAIAGGIHELVYARVVRGRAASLPQLGEELVRFTLLLLGVPPRRA